ncbi:hypothetical protein RJT34_31387 [Clitoria ternatea]|uniref:Uncharacterized protein n=1 Tax=Clitoria ternatea TaxID=43366 RepID=A0AAN9EYH0_CLITE
MRNGGLNSFVFHPSPRMIPHVLKPEVQYVEFSIEKFIPRQKNANDDQLHISPSKDKLTVAEIDLLETYFHPTEGNECRLSLIAFPHFQTFPSKVHKVKHSCRAFMLMDVMQHLQGLVSFPGDNKTLFQDQVLLPFLDYPADGKSFLFLFSMSAHESCSGHIMGRNAVSVNCLELDSCHFGIQTKDFVDLTLQANTLYELGEHQKEVSEGDETIPETPITKRSVTNEGDKASEMVNLGKIEPLLVADVCIHGMRDEELSPRLTNLIRSGVVPESPIDERGESLQGESRKKSVIQDCILPLHLQEEKYISSLSTSEVVINDGDTGKNVCTSPVHETQTPLLDLKNCAIKRGRVILSQAEEGCVHITDPSCFSEEVYSGCGEMSVRIKSARKFKRLRKAEDTESNMNQKNNKLSAATANFPKSSASNPLLYKHGQGKRKSNVRDFIEEEAEVSSDAYVSNDEDDEDGNSFDSFIDDRTNPTAASQPEASRMDMMAIYRRSLLSQAPIDDFSGTLSPDHVTMAASICISECGDSSVSHFQTEAGSETGTDVRCRKRRLAFYHSGNMPTMNLEPEFALQSKKEAATADVGCEDQFYNDLDLDELEAQATLLLKQKQDAVPQFHSHTPNLDTLGSPSFDLGI